NLLSRGLSRTARPLSRRMPPQPAPYSKHRARTNTVFLDTLWDFRVPRSGPSPSGSVVAARGLEHVDDDHRDVVSSTRGQGDVNEPGGRLICRPARLELLPQRLVTHLLGQAVRADEQAHPTPDRNQPIVDHGLGVEPDRP